MINRKKNGSYYTPKELAEFIIEYIYLKTLNKQDLSILEPSAGDGIFISSIINYKDFAKKVSFLSVIEKNKNELSKIKLKNNKNFIKFYNQDFLNFRNTDNFDLIIGNPPYIKKKFLTKRQVKFCEYIHLENELSNKKINNIWTSFLLKSIGLLKENGVLAFILPAELLQVNFTVEIREFLKNKFQRLEIFTFDELLFKECKRQDTVLIIGEKKSNTKGIYYNNVKNLKKLKAKYINLKSNESIQVTQTKWIHHLVQSDDLQFLHNIKKRIKEINDYCCSKAGIVTAANNYFIINKDILEEFSLKDYTIPIIQKGSYINGNVVMSKRNFEELIKKKKPTYLLNFNNLDDSNKKKISNYLDLGVEQKLQLRYKCLKRNNWFEVPNIGEPSDGFFFKRTNKYPKLLKNSAKVQVTDSAYKVNMKMNFSINDLIYSFYNSFTLLFAELSGRYYGGGVLELTPNEFKNLPLPFISITSKEFKKFRMNFETKNSIDEICFSNDYSILNSILNISEEEINKIQSIKDVLFNRRIRNN